MMMMMMMMMMMRMMMMLLLLLMMIVLPVAVPCDTCRSYSILDEEDDVIAAHRQQIEDSMEMVQVMCDV
jgi:hypothetical protein